VLKTEHKSKIWDVPTRVFHWALAVAILTSFISVRRDEMEIHFLSGSVVLFLILFRVLWGLWGPETALFLQFAPLPKRIAAWRAGGSIGHSPLAALSVFAMLGIIGGQAISGLFVDDGIYLTGPLRDNVTSATANTATKLHARLSDVIIILVALHVIAILFYTLVKHSPLLKVFLTGYSAEAGESIRPRSLFVVAATIAIAAAPVIWIFN